MKIEMSGKDNEAVNVLKAKKHRKKHNATQHNASLADLLVHAQEQ